MDKEFKGYFENIQNQLGNIEEDVKEIKKDVKENSVKEQELEVSHVSLKTKVNIYASIGGSLLLVLLGAACRLIFF